MSRPYRSLAECRRLYATLTPMQKFTLVRLAQGLNCKEISELRGVSYSTPEGERIIIYEKLGYSNPTQLTFFCLRLNLIKIQKT